MPPSRGLLPAAQLLNRTARSAPSSRIHSRYLSSASLPSHAHASRRAVVASIVPSTTTQLRYGRANISFSELLGKRSGEVVLSREGAPVSAGNSTVAPSTQEEQQVAAGASHTETPPISDAATASPATQTNEVFPSLEEVQSAITPATETITYIGQMKHLGLDFGWGPTSVVQWILEHAHVYSGTDWWASIVIAALTIRLITFPLFRKAAHQQAIMMRLQPRLQQLNAESREARAAGDLQLSQLLTAETKVLMKREGVSLRWSFLPIVAQGSLAFGAWKLTRAMCGLPVPGLETGGILWLKNLTLSDPYYLLPIVMFAVSHIQARLGGEAGGADQMGSAMRPILVWVLPAFLFMFTSTQPGLLQLSIFTSVTIGVLQTQLLRLNRFRRLIRIAPLRKPKAPRRRDGNAFQTVNSTVQTGNSTVQTGNSTVQTVNSTGQVSVPPVNDAFANLRTIRKGAAGNESPFRYQPPSALKIASSTAPAATPVTSAAAPAAEDAAGKAKGGFVRKELENMKNAGSKFMKEVETKAEGWSQDAGTSNAGDKGRDKLYLQRAKEYEKRKLESEKKDREERRKMRGKL